MGLQKFRHLLIGAAAVTLCACGGGSGGGLGPVPFVPPPPPPPPPPTCTEPCYTSAEIFPEIENSTEFAVVGLEAGAANATELVAEGFAIRYDASSGDYVMDFPSTEAGAFQVHANDSPNDTWLGGAVRSSSGATIADAHVLKTSNPELQLSHTTLVGYNTSTSENPFGWAAFGTATPSAEVPVSGSATYTAIVGGSSIDGWGEIGGSANLRFDFGAGDLSGHFDPVYYYLGGMGESYQLGRYTFENTIFGVGSATFSGELRQPGLTGIGTFDGLFTGPNAQELMARWNAPFVDPINGTTSTLFGVWVGKGQ